MWSDPPIDVDAIRQRIDEIDRELTRLVELRAERAALVRFVQMGKELFGVDIGDLDEAALDADLRHFLPAVSRRVPGRPKRTSSPERVAESSVVRLPPGRTDRGQPDSGHAARVGTRSGEPRSRNDLSGLSHPDAIIWTLLTYSDPDEGMTIQEILEALLMNGWETRADDPLPVIRSALNRLVHDEGMIVRVGRGRYAVAEKLRYRSQLPSSQNWRDSREASKSQHAN